MPPFTPSSVFTQWEISPVLFVLLVWATGLYLYGVWRLHDRGDKWPIGRTLSFVVGGMGSFFFATCSGLAVYDDTLLSVHMVQHMVLSMAVPVFCALGAPVTLALRTLHKRPRAVLLSVLHSRVARVLTFPPLTFALFVISPWALYFTGWYDATLHSNFLHELMHLHLVIVGALFFTPIVGIDPVPGRVGYPFRLLLLVLTLPFHAFLGVTIMSQDTLIGHGWYPALHASDAVAAERVRRPAPRGRHPLGLRRPRRDLGLRRPVLPVGALVDGRGEARGPPPRPARTRCRERRGGRADHERGRRAQPVASAA